MFASAAYSDRIAHRCSQVLQIAIGLHIDVHRISIYTEYYFLLQKSRVQKSKNSGVNLRNDLRTTNCTKMAATRLSKGTPLEGFVRVLPGLLKAGGIKVRGFENGLISQMVKTTLCIKGF